MPHDQRTDEVCCADAAQDTAFKSHCSPPSYAPTKRLGSTSLRLTTSIAPGRVALVRTGLIIEVPTGHFLGIFARSSTPLKRGLLVANGVGVIDPDYSGPKDEVMVQVLNFTAG